MITIKSIEGKNESRKPESIPDTKFGNHFDGENFYFFESDKERIDFLEALPKQTVIKYREVASWKIKAVLKLQGLYDLIEQALTLLQEPTKTIAEMAWKHSETINQFSPTVQMIKQICELSDEQIQTIFDESEKINI